jgi:hypothetical protein
MTKYVMMAITMLGLFGLTAEGVKAQPGNNQNLEYLYDIVVKGKGPVGAEYAVGANGFMKGAASTTYTLEIHATPMDQDQDDIPESGLALVKSFTKTTDATGGGFWNDAGTTLLVPTAYTGETRVGWHVWVRMKRPDGSVAYTSERIWCYKD